MKQALRAANKMSHASSGVIPAQAGIQKRHWIPVTPEADLPKA